MQAATRLSDPDLEFGKRGILKTLSSRVLVVEDSEPFRKFICSTLGEKPELEILAEVTDGLQAVQKAAELQPDLIVLDIGLPSLNGIEAARRIRSLCPESKILFLSQESSPDVVRAALGAGARGYVVKTDAGSELVESVNTVLRGERFVGRRFSRRDFVEGAAEVALQIKNSFASIRRNSETGGRHEARFYSDDRLLLNDITQFIGIPLKAGNAAIVVATELHRNSLLPRLEAHGVDIAVAVEQGRYISVDAADAVTRFMVNGMPDPTRFLNLFGNLIATAAEAARGPLSRVAVFGEGVHLLWAQSNAEAAIRVEELCNKLAETYDVDILCGYFPGRVQGGMDSHIFERICQEHSAVCTL